MTSQVLIIIAVSTIVPAIMGYMAKANKKEVPANDHGAYLLRVNKVYFITGIGGFLVGLGLSVAGILSSIFTNNYTTLIFSFPVGIAMAALGVICFLWYKNHHVSFDSEYIEIQTLYGKKHTLKWNDIHAATFKPKSGILTLTTETGSKIKILYYLVGFNTFVDMMEQKTRWTATELEIPINRK